MLFFLSKNPCGHAINRQNAWVSEMRNFKPGLHERVEVRTILTEPKCLGCRDNHIFLLMLLFCALPEHESSAINFVNHKGTNYGRHSLRKFHYLKLPRWLYSWKNCTNLSLSGWLGVNADFFKDLITLKDQVFYFVGYNMTSSARDGTKASVLTYHRIIEAFKFGFAWRSRLGDPGFNKNKNIDKVSERLLYSWGYFPIKVTGMPSENFANTS